MAASSQRLASSAKNISVHAEWVRKSGHAPSEQSETVQWRSTPCPASIPPVAFHIALRSQANYNHTMEWVHSVHTCIGIAMGYAAKISPCVPSTLSLKGVGRRWEDMILPYREDPRNTRQELVRPKVRKDSVWIFIVWQDEMKMRCCLSTPGSPEYILRVAHFTSISPLSPDTYRRSLIIELEAVIKLDWECTWRPRSSELRDALGGPDRWSLEMHWEAMIERVWICTWRPRWSELSDALGGRDGVNSEMHLEALIERVWICTWSPWLSEFGHALGGRDWVNSEMHSEAVTKQVRRCTGRLWSSEIGGVLGGGCWTWDDKVLSICCTRWMLYLVYAALSVNSWLWHGDIERDDLTSCS